MIISKTNLVAIAAQWNKEVIEMFILISLSGSFFLKQN